MKSFALLLSRSFIILLWTVQSVIDLECIFWMWYEVVEVVIPYFHVDIELLHHHSVKTPSFLHSRAMTPLLKVR